MRASVWSPLLAGVYFLGCAEAFLAPTSFGKPVSTKQDVFQNFMFTKLLLSEAEKDQLELERLEKSFFERSRRDRRDFFNYDKWVQYRSPNRFSSDLFSVFRSSIVMKLFLEVSLISGVAVFVWLWNCFLVEGFVDLDGIRQDPLLHLPLLSLPVQPFSLTSPSISLLLAFRVNTSYQRWDEARKAWGVTVNNCRTILRQASAWILKADLPDQEKQELLSRIAFAVWAFPRSLRRHLLSEYEDEESFVADVKATLPEPFASDLINSKRHRPSRALFELSTAINELPIEIFRRQGMDESVSQLCNAMGGCDRVYSTPKTKFYTRHTSRYMFVWLLFLPLALWEPMSASWNHSGMLFITTLIAMGILGIEELAIQLEEPFSILPLKEITDGIGKSAIEHAEWETQSRGDSRISSEHVDLSGWNPAWDISQGVYVPRKDPTPAYASTVDYSTVATPTVEKKTTVDYSTVATPTVAKKTTVDYSTVASPTMEKKTHDSSNHAKDQMDERSPEEIASAYPSFSSIQNKVMDSTQSSFDAAFADYEEEVKSMAEASFDAAYTDLTEIQKEKDQVMYNLRSEILRQSNMEEMDSTQASFGAAFVESQERESKEQPEMQKPVKKSYSPWRPNKKK